MRRASPPGHLDGVQPSEPWKPPSDPIFQHLLSEASVTGRVPVHGIIVSPGRVVPFDPMFHPETTEEGGRVVAAIIREWQAGRPARMWVYPCGDLFVASDDYFTLAAIRRGQPDSIACFCLGKPDDTLVYSNHGPIALNEIRRALGLTITD